MIGSIRNASASGIRKARLACRASLAGVIATVIAVLALSLTGLTARPAIAAGGGQSAGGYQPPPALPVNSCNDTSLPRSYGTNFPVPNDPHGFGFANQSVIGWEGNWYAPFAYPSGSYFARGVPAHHTPRSTTYCGAMYSFGIYAYGLQPGQAELRRGDGAKRDVAW